METITPIILGVVAVLAMLAVAIVFLRKRSAERLRSHFGPEYERTVEAVGDRHKAQAELHQRQKRVRNFAIKSLTSEEREHYTPLWAEVQTQFIEDPKAAVAEADQLLAEVMTHRGYPAADFEQRYADLSVDHPVAVQGYRTAHDIAVRDAQGEANTEDLRQAVLCYRTLFRELVDQPVVGEPIIEEQSEPADASTNEEPTPTEAAPTAADEDADEDMIDEPVPTVEPVLAEKPANVAEPMRT